MRNNSLMSNFNIIYKLFNSFSINHERNLLVIKNRPPLIIIGIYICLSFLFGIVTFSKSKEMPIISRVITLSAGIFCLLIIGGKSDISINFRTHEISKLKFQYWVFKKTFTIQNIKSNNFKIRRLSFAGSETMPDRYVFYYDIVGKYLNFGHEANDIKGKRIIILMQGKPQTAEDVINIINNNIIDNSIQIA
jgi:hypothetical protein